MLVLEQQALYPLGHLPSPRKLITGDEPSRSLIRTVLILEGRRLLGINNEEGRIGVQGDPLPFGVSREPGPSLDLQSL